MVVTVADGGRADVRVHGYCGVCTGVLLLGERLHGVTGRVTRAVDDAKYAYPCCD